MGQTTLCINPRSRTYDFLLTGVLRDLEFNTRFEGKLNTTFGNQLGAMVCNSALHPPHPQFVAIRSCTAQVELAKPPPSFPTSSNIVVCIYLAKLRGRRATLAPPRLQQ